MKHIRWQGIAFFLLIFLLGIGLSYLAFNETKTETPEETHTMRVALVNEDDGALFNDEKIVFGDEFATGINKDSSHDWYLVSRGVAESGFNRNLYDMMIVIPNDFSEKSLSIHLDRPEPVALHYKINATGHEDVRAEAEKTAGKILNDFNKRLIDVYFASIIGNLQDAQDNIADIIREEVDYVNVYHHNVHSPLANYTNQFSSLHQYTDHSIENHQGLEAVLDSFAESLADDANNNEDFASEMDSVIQQKSDYSALKNQFNDFFQQFLQNLRGYDLNELKNQNSLVHKQFQPEEERDAPDSIVRMEEPRNKTLLTHALELRNKLESRKKEMESFQRELEETIDEELVQVIKDRLEVVFEEEEVNDSFGEVLQGLDKKIHKEIHTQLSQLPTLEADNLEDTALTGNTLKNIKETMKIGNQYLDESKSKFDRPTGPLPLDETISKMKQALAKHGMVATDSLSDLPDYDQGSVVKIIEPDGYTLTKLVINNKRYNHHKEIKINDLRDADIEATFKLTDADSSVDVFEPLEWNWAVYQEGMEKKEEDEKTPEPEEPGQDEGQSDDEGNEEENDNADSEDEAPENGETNDEEASDQTEDDVTTADTSDADTGNAGSEKAEPTEGDEINNNPAPPESSSETIIKTNNYFKQKVQTDIPASLVDAQTDDITALLITTAAETVSEYNKLAALFELYYGFDKKDNETDKNAKKSVLFAFDPDQSLSEQASDDSLYSFIHETDLKELAKKFIGDKITKQMTEGVQDSLDDIQRQIAKYKEAINQTNAQSDRLAEIVSNTRVNANELNKEVAALLDETSKWYETSQALEEDQAVVMTNDGDMNTAMMGLNQSYQPLLMASASLQEQAHMNFDSADRVYQTLDALDEEAESIQASGTNLVTDATDLANQLTEKAADDTDFAENFNDVLANSRIGDRQNEHLYSFLANPVETKNDGLIMERENFTAYFLVLIMAMVTLFTAYVLSNMGERKMAVHAFREDATFMGANMPISLMTAGIGAIEGLVIGLVSFYLLSLEQNMLFIWIGLIVFMTMAMLLIATYLLRQLNMFGMFILLAVFSLYLFLSRSLGFRFENNGLISTLRQVSPLQYAESLLANVLDGKGSFAVLSLVFLAVLAGIGFLINLLVFHKRSGGELDEDAAEAN